MPAGKSDAVFTIISELICCVSVAEDGEKIRDEGMPKQRAAALGP